ncbi:MAG TPA: hydrogenase maturation nickel metallochaperone HypA [Bryobacteraceae bacterium]|jgi:hydrogenase nickel incorporation protein HypA/HybF
MHELSIAISLVEAAEEELQKLGSAKVLAIHLELGRLSGVVKDALEFSYQIACENTALAGSRLVIEEIPVLIDCPVCKAPREIVALQDFRCAACGAAGGAVLQGRELRVAALEITENEVACP